jgi:hypothetical protein
MIDAGVLDQHVAVLSLVQNREAGKYFWSTDWRTWAKVETDNRSNIFSSVGIGARGLTFTMRGNRKLTLEKALLWRKQFCFLTSITDAAEPGFVTVKAAICQPTDLTAKPQNRTGRDQFNRPTTVGVPEFSFPGILTELYHRNDADDVYRAETLQRVLVTPKAIVLRAGDLVKPSEGAAYTVRQVMDLDIYKNEYVIERQEDV